jgi:hypothetical protein
VVAPVDRNPSAVGSYSFLLGQKAICAIFVYRVLTCMGAFTFNLVFVNLLSCRLESKLFKDYYLFDYIITLWHLTHIILAAYEILV